MPDLKPKNVKGVMKTLQVLPYKGHLIYIRQIYEKYFEYLVSIEGEIYSSYILIEPRKGKKKLTKSDIAQAAALITTGAVTTINTKLGVKLDKEQEKKAEAFLKASGQVN